MNYESIMIVTVYLNLRIALLTLARRYMMRGHQRAPRSGGLTRYEVNGVWGPGMRHVYWLWADLLRLRVTNVYYNFTQACRLYAARIGDRSRRDPHAANIVTQKLHGQVPACTIVRAR